MKDLRFMTAESHAAFGDIVLKGTLADRGMIGFADVLTRPRAEAIHAVPDRARQRGLRTRGEGELTRITPRRIRAHP
jgi:hypothetical protein